MENVTWFTTIGTSAPAVYNTILAAYFEKNMVPVRICLFRLIPESPTSSISRDLEKSFNKFNKWLAIFSKHTGGKPQLDIQQIDETDYQTFAKTYRKVFKKKKDLPRVIDITPGRKFASAIGLKIGLEAKARSIFYLHLLDKRYLNYSYTEIPRPLLKFVDFMEDL